MLSPFGDLFRRSWELYKKKIAGLAALLALPFIAQFILNLVAPAKTTSDGSLHSLNYATSYSFGGVGLLFAIIFLVVWLWIQVALIKDIDSGEAKPNIGQLLSSSWPLVLSMLLVAVLVGLSILGGLILLIVPGIIFGLWFSLSSFTLVLENKRGTEALKSSKAYVKGHTGQLFGRLILLWLVAIVLSIVVAIVVGLFPKVLQDLLNAAISSFVVTPFGLIFMYEVYRDLKGRAAAPAAAPAETPAAK